MRASEIIAGAFEVMDTAGVAAGDHVEMVLVNVGVERMEGVAS